MIKQKYDTYIYPVNVIKQGIKDYKEIADIKLAIVGNYAYCFFAKCKYSEKETVLEFNNYLIDLIGANN